MAVCAKSKMKFQKMFALVRMSKDYVDSIYGILKQGQPGWIVEFLPSGKENYYMVEFSHYPKKGETVIVIPESYLEYVYTNGEKP